MAQRWEQPLQCNKWQTADGSSRGRMQDVLQATSCPSKQRTMIALIVQCHAAERPAGRPSVDGPCCLVDAHTCCTAVEPCTDRLPPGSTSSAVHSSERQCQRQQAPHAVLIDACSSDMGDRKIKWRQVKCLRASGTAATATQRIQAGC